MKTSSLPFLILPFLIACKQTPKEPAQAAAPKAKAHTGLELSAVVGGLSWLNQENAFILTTLYNPTKDTLEYVTMRCSYEEYFLTDTAAFEVIPHNECNSNYPQVKHLPPGCKVDQYVVVSPTNDTATFAGSKFRVGMYKLTMDDVFALDDPAVHFNKAVWMKYPIIWSEPIDMDRIYRKVYK